ncbi:MAG: M16 family metallopeptidase [Acidimicrobiales bacterium]
MRVPAVELTKPARLPTVNEQVLPNGLRVLAVRRASVPTVHAVLTIPIAREGRDNPAVRDLMAETMLSGTAEHTATSLAEQLQRLGATLDVSADPDDLTISGGSLSSSFAAFMDVMAQVVTSPTFPKKEVAIERGRMVEELVVSRSQPATIARHALLSQLYGDHAYSDPLPFPADVERIGAPALERAHASRTSPEGSVLVIVGDLRPDRAIDLAERSFGQWPGQARHPRALRPPGAAPLGPTLVVDRPGAVQTNIRLAGAAPMRRDSGFPALAMANTIFGGNFTSRLVENLRERRGYTYSPRSAVAEQALVARFVVAADVATEVTAKALLETRYELARMSLEPVSPEELSMASRYLSGVLAISAQTQGGLAATISSLTSSGLSIEFLRDFPKSLAAAAAEAVRVASAAFLAPRDLVTVLVGDASRIVASLEATDHIEVVPLPGQVVAG